LPVWAKAVADLSWFTALSNLADFFIASIVRPSGLFWSQADFFQGTAASVNLRPVSDPGRMNPDLLSVCVRQQPADDQRENDRQLTDDSISSASSAAEKPGPDGLTVESRRGVTDRDAEQAP